MNAPNITLTAPLPQISSETWCGRPPCDTRPYRMTHALHIRNPLTRALYVLDGTSCPTNQSIRPRETTKSTSSSLDSTSRALTPLLRNEALYYAQGAGTAKRPRYAHAWLPNLTRGTIIQENGFFPTQHKIFQEFSRKQASQLNTGPTFSRKKASQLNTGS